MNETVAELVQELIYKVEKGEKFVGNEKDLFMLDAENADQHIEELEEKADVLEGTILIDENIIDKIAEDVIVAIVDVDLSISEIECEMSKILHKWNGYYEA